MPVGNRNAISQVVPLSPWHQQRRHWPRCEEGELQTCACNACKHVLLYFKKHLDSAPPFTEDIMQAIFNLHPTFPTPQREVTAPPFEIEEHGWGEFEVNVVVSDLTAKPA